MSNLNVRLSIVLPYILLEYFVLFSIVFNLYKKPEIINVKNLSSYLHRTVLKYQEKDQTF